MIQAFAGYTVAHPVREDDHFVLLRATREADGLPVLVLCPRDACHDALARLEHEYALRAELDGAWAATPLALVRGGPVPALVLAGGAAAPLQIQAGQPYDTSAFLRLGLAIAHALAQLHRHDIVHKDLRPGHVLLEADGAVRLTGFGIATRLRGLPPLPEHQLSGSFAYMAPEQTGRMNRAVDTRSDLYSLGVLLYQLLCGELPFNASDPMQWIHCHVARAPLPPSQHHPGADPTLSAIVMKLLSKSAEQRYQSASGLHADLRYCQELFEAGGAITSFALARNDGPARLQHPDMLVGRARELGVLEAAAMRVAAGGAAELVTVSGNAGTGKSALLAALRHSSALGEAVIVAAKFEQHGCDIPFATLSEAVRELVCQRLGQSEAMLAPWRAALRSALGPNARLMLELIPELSHVVGESAAPVALSPLEAQARFQAVFCQLLACLAGPDQMLLLCLDDLQWVDAATLRLLSHLMTHPDVQPVLVVGACRTSEVGATHVLAQACDSMRRQGAVVHQLTLQALTRSQTGELVAAALGCVAPKCAPLAELVFGKTAGNPFFTLQFLTRLVENGLLRYRHADEGWEWDAAAISERAFSDNVIELMIARLQQLPYSTLELVKLLACLGHEASLDTLAQMAGMSALETDESLWPAARLGLVQRQAGTCCFSHDRVREAAYCLITRASLPERHLHIGRQLQERLAPAELERQVFTVAGHLNRARAAIDDPAELAALAALNVRAGERARAATAFDAARHYFDLAAALTPPGAWRERFDPTFNLFSALAETEYLCGNLERADDLFGRLVEQARSRLELARVALMRVALYQVSGRFDLAVTVSLDALALFGVTFAQGAQCVSEALAAERAEVAHNLAGRSVADLEREPLSEDPEIVIVTELMTDMGSSVFSARPLIYPLLALKALNFTLRFGSSATSCMTYSRYAIFLVSLGAVGEAFAFSDLARRLAAGGTASSRRAGRLDFVHGAYVHPWRLHVADSVELLEQACAACQEAGDLPHAGYAAHIATWTRFEAGQPLGQVQQRARHYQALARQQHNEVLMQLLRCYEQLTLCLQGATGAEGSFDDEHFSAADALAAMDKARFGAAKARFHLMRQLAAYTFGRYQEALDAAEAARAERHFFLASITDVSHHFYYALTMTALYPDAPAERQGAYLHTLQEIDELLRVWAAQCPANFAHRHLLVSAEMARIAGRGDDAVRQYDASLQAARAGGFVQHEALAGELAARFHQQRGFGELALGYARDALQACGHWGAYGKMRELERRFPGLVRVPSPLPHSAPEAAGLAEDAAAILAAEAWDAIAVTRLAETLLRSVIEQAGAGRAMLLLPEQGGYRCAAEGWVDAAGMQVAAGAAQHAPAAQAVLPVTLPRTLLQFVLRTRQTVLLDDALTNAQFQGDPYVRQAHPRSVLCMPLLQQGALAGVLYLENTLAPGIFTPMRVRVLERIAAQAAVALASVGATPVTHCA